MLATIDRALGGWPARPDGTRVLPEYRAALETCSVMLALMRDSSTRRVIEILDAELSGSTPLPPAPDLILQIIMKAYNTTASRAASCSGAMDGVCDHAIWLSASLHFLSSLTWETRYLLAALRMLLPAESSDGLRIVLALMARAANECASRKRATFSFIVSRVVPSDAPAPLPMPAVLSGSSPEVRAACERLQRVCGNVVQDMKDRAFDSTFMQPALMYGTAVGSELILRDGDVHGAPTYLALLEAATGVRTSRLPELDDEAKAIADAMQAGGADSALARLWADDALGRSFTSIRECVHFRPSHGSRGINWIAFPMHGAHTVRSYAALAADPSPALAANRAAFAVYVTQFMHYFRPELLLQRLFTAVTAGSLAGAENGMLAELQMLFDYLKSAGDDDGVEAAARIPADCVDVQYYVWDMESYPPVMNVPAARRLFAAIGVVKPAGWQLQPASAASAAGGSSALSTPTAAAAVDPVLPPRSLRLRAAGDICGGGTGREFVANLLNNSTNGWDKWLHPGRVTQSWVQADLQDGPRVITGYGMCSANDMPIRDPTQWRLMGRVASTGVWVRLHSFPEDATADTQAGFLTRWQWLWFSIPDSQPVTAVRLEITGVRGAGDSDLQLGHWHLRGHIPGATSAVAAGVVPSGGHSPLRGHPPGAGSGLAAAAVSRISKESIVFTAGDVTDGADAGLMHLHQDEVFDEWHEWDQFGYETTSYVQMSFTAPAVSTGIFSAAMAALLGLSTMRSNEYVVTAYEVQCGASPGGSFASWELQGQRADGSWILLHAFAGGAEVDSAAVRPPSARWHWLRFPITAPQLVKALRLQLTASAPALELGHFHAFGIPAVSR